METLRGETQNALVDLQNDLNAVLKYEGKHPPDGAVLCEDQEEQEVVSWIDLDGPKLVGVDKINSTLRIGFIESFKRHGDFWENHFYRFDGISLALIIDEGTSEPIWNIIGTVKSYHLENG